MDRKQKLLDRCEAMSLLCIKSSYHWSLIKFILSIPVILINSILCILNSLDDKSFDLVISINTIHNLEKAELVKALQEIQRVSRKNCFITVDAYRNNEEKELMYAWNLTAKTIMHVDEWKAFFNEVGYKGDYYWFIP